MPNNKGLIPDDLITYAYVSANLVQTYTNEETVTGADRTVHKS